MKQSRLWPVLWPKIEEILSSVPPPNDLRLEISGLLLLGADLKISVSYEGESTQWMGQDDGYYSRSDLTVQTNKVTLIQRLLRLSYEIWIETGSLSASSCQLNSHRETSLVNDKTGTIDWNQSEILSTLSSAQALEMIAWEMDGPSRSEREIFVNWNQFVKLHLELQLMMTEIIGEGEAVSGVILTSLSNDHLQYQSVGKEWKYFIIPIVKYFSSESSRDNCRLFGTNKECFENLHGFYFF